jgi:putative redox protein
VSLTAKATSIGETLQQDVEIGPHRLVTDQPLAAGGSGSGPSPHELLPAALAACVVWSIARYAQTKGWKHRGVSATVTYDHKATPRHVELDVVVGGDLTPDQLDRLSHVVAACPVRRSLETGFEFVEHLRGA